MDDNGICHMAISNYETEVMGQPEALGELLKVYSGSDTPLNRLDGFLKGRRPSSVVFIGMGTSLSAPIPAVCLLSDYGIPARAYDAGEFRHYLLGSIEENALIVIISQSGESAELKIIAETLKRPYVAITNTENSTLARNAAAVLPMCGGVEVSTTNRTFTNSIAACLLLAGKLAGKHTDIIKALAPAPDAMKEVLNNWRDFMVPVAGFFGNPPHFDLLGRGPSMACVTQGGLILRELAHLQGGVYTTGNFRHGMVPSMKRGGMVVVISPSGKTADLNRGLVDDVLATGGKAILITDRNEKPADSLMLIRLPALGELYSTLVTILPIELLGVLAAESRNMDPGGDIAKVTTKE
jgi:glucosamine--fructose-6-phosphate aminotransferase (isomerizing)